jgi:hypothetical protein
MSTIRVLCRRLQDVWSERPGVDWLVAFVLVTLHVVAAHFGGPGHFLRELDGQQRSTVYTSAASVSALVGGFGTAAISQYVTAGGGRMLQLRRHYGRSLRNNWSGILSSMLIVSGFSLVCLIVDSGEQVGREVWAFEFILIFGILRSVRLVWLFRLLIAMADTDVSDPPRSPPVGIPDD